MRSSTDQLHNVAVQGPKSRDILREVIWTPPAQPALAELGWFRFTIGRIGGYDGAPVVVSRTGYTGELGYEVFCHPKDALTVFDAIWEAGAPHGLMPLGLQALDMLRIEAGLAFRRLRILRPDRSVRGRDRFHRAAGLEERRFHRPRGADRGAKPTRSECWSAWRWTAMKRWATAIACIVGRAQVGVITSATRSPVLKKTIALARVDVTSGELGTQLEVGKLDGEQKRLPARVVRFPHFDPEKTRVRS